MPMTELVEKRNELETKQALLAKVFEDAGTDMDMNKVQKIGDEDVSKWSSVQKAEKIRKLNDELADLGAEVESLAAAEEAGKTIKIKSRMIHPTGDGDGNKGETSEPKIKTIADAFVETHKAGLWKAFMDRKHVIAIPDMYPSDLYRQDAQVKEFLKTLFKTDFTTSAGWAPESIRLPGYVDAVTRPIQVIDIIPAARTGQAAIVYMLETTRTHSAAEKAEAAAYAESTFALTATTSTVRKITDSIPVTDEQLDDVPAAEGYLNNRLQFGVRQRLDYQIVQGNGSAPNLLGLMNLSSIQSQAKGADPVPDAVYKAMTLVRVTGRAQPNYVLCHPNDWQGVRLLRTSDGIYIWGNPSEAGPARIWGISVVQTDCCTENTGIVGDFANFSTLYERKGVEVEVGYVNDDFVKGLKTLRAQVRVAFVVTRDTAFCKVTGI